MERYFYRIPDWHGEFRNAPHASGPRWSEFQNGVKFVDFTEESRSAAHIVLFDTTRNLRVRLPIAGGASHWKDQNTPDWVQLYQVDRVERYFTAGQAFQLTQDTQRARDMLDRVLARLTESIIVPTPSLVAMRERVRNIFHVNLVDADPAYALTEAFHFAELVANFKQLRSAGFDQQPQYVFEPDYTGPLVAWVVGVDDPKVHIAPSHFYMDRDNVVVTLIHERAHTVLRLNGHPPNTNYIPARPEEGDPNMTRDDAMSNPYCYEWLTLALQ